MYLFVFVYMLDLKVAEKWVHTLRPLLRSLQGEIGFTVTLSL